MRNSLYNSLDVAKNFPEQQRLRYRFACVIDFGLEIGSKVPPSESKIFSQHTSVNKTARNAVLRAVPLTERLEEAMTAETFT